MEKAKKVKAQEFYTSSMNQNLINACIESNAPLLLIGETGTGKTTILREIAKERKKSLVRISVNGSMGVEEILGKWLVEEGTTKWQDGILTSAMKKGSWVVMDEINAALPEILFTLHSLLDDDRAIILPEKDNELVRPHKDFRFFATMNPPEEYAGTKDMNKALLSRFTAVLKVDVLSEIKEAQLLEKKGAKAEDAALLVKVASFLRLSKSRDDIFYYCSTRDLVQVVELMNGGVMLNEAFQGAVINKMTPDEYEEVRNEIKKHLYEKVEIPTKTIAELVDAVNDAEKAIENALSKQQKEHEKQMEKVRSEAEEAASDKVSKEFLEKLGQLAKKK